MDGKNGNAMIETDNIYNMDCLEGMRLLDDGSVDAVIADLPYGMLNRKNRSAAWDRQIPLEPLWEQYLRITKPESPIITGISRAGKRPSNAFLKLLFRLDVKSRKRRSSICLGDNAGFKFRQTRHSPAAFPFFASFRRAAL